MKPFEIVEMKQRSVWEYDPKQLTDIDGMREMM